MEELLNTYHTKKPEIQERLSKFKKMWSKPDRAIYEEMVYCLCVAGGQAHLADKAVKRIIRSKALYQGTPEELRSQLTGVRFPNNKTRFLVESRKVFVAKKRVKIKQFLDPDNTRETRDWLVKNVLGFNYKEASHFLRNIGLGEDLAILDVHILNEMKRLKIISKIELPSTRKKYLALEKKLEIFSKKTGISMGELDILFWSNRTGNIFK